MIVPVVAHAGASRSRVAWDGEVLQVWVTAPPHDAKANHAITDLLAAALGVPRSRVELVRGARGRSKLFRVDQLEPAALDRLR